jgi:hypothetical protein
MFSPQAVDEKEACILCLLHPFLKSNGFKIKNTSVLGCFDVYISKHAHPTFNNGS